MPEKPTKTTEKVAKPSIPAAEPPQVVSEEVLRLNDIVTWAALRKRSDLPHRELYHRLQVAACDVANMLDKT